MDPARDQPVDEGPGRIRALKKLLDRNHDRLRSVTERLLGPRLSARVSVSDVVQSCFVDLMRSFHGFKDSPDDDSAFQAWSRRVLENGVRRKSRYYSAGKRAAEMESVSLEYDRAANTPTPSFHAVNAENLARLKQAVERLTPDQREVIRLHVLEGRPHDEIADRIGRSSEATRMLLSRARARLLVELEQVQLARRDD